MGEELCACVRVAPGESMSEDELKAFCKDQVIFVDQGEKTSELTLLLSDITFQSASLRRIPRRLSHDSHGQNSKEQIARIGDQKVESLTIFLEQAFFINCCFFIINFLFTVLYIINIKLKMSYAMRSV